MEPTTVYTDPLSGEEVRVSTEDFNGSLVFTIQVWSSDGSSMRPTRSIIRLPPSTQTTLDAAITAQVAGA